MSTLTVNALEGAASAPLQASGSRMPKLMHLQILRALASSLVVVDHSIAALDFRGVPCERYLDAGLRMGVAAFFAMSGLIMVRQSADRFAVPGSSMRFWYYRLIRIVPMYWLATLLWFTARIRWHNAMPHALSQLALSLCFLPNFYDVKSYMNPVMGAGWTLNYEMGFYLLFGLCLYLPRRFGIPCVFALLVAFRQAGALGLFDGGGVVAHLLKYYSTSIIILFAFGVLLGGIEIWIDRPARISSRISPALLLLIPPLIYLAFPGHAQAAALSKWPGWYSAGVVVLCTITNLEQPGWLNRGLALLGNASYSTYLFHLWIAPLLFPLFFNNAAIPFRGAAFILACVVGANAVGVAIHLAFERPLLRALRKKRFPRFPGAVSTALRLSPDHG